MSFRPPEFMVMTFILLYGVSEDIVVLGMTREKLAEFIEVNQFKTHPRLVSLKLTGPDDSVLETYPEEK